MAGTSSSWKHEHARVSKKGSSRPRSNKYSGGDSDTKPAAGERERIWVGGYDRADGKHIEGYYRSTPGQ